MYCQYTAKVQIDLMCANRKHKNKLYADYPAHENIWTVGSFTKVLEIMTKHGCFKNIFCEQKRFIGISERVAVNLHRLAKITKFLSQVFPPDLPG